VMFRVTQIHRPAVLGQNFYYVSGLDDLGMAVALAASGAMTIGESVRLFSQIRQGEPEEAEAGLPEIAFADPRIKIICGSSGKQFTTREDVRSYMEEKFGPRWTGLRQ